MLVTNAPDDFVRVVDDLHSQCLEEEFEPKVHYRADIDSLVLLAKDHLWYRKRVNRSLNVFVSDDTGEVIGAEIKGFSRMVENMRRFNVPAMIADHPRLGVFLAMAVINDGHDETIIRALARFSSMPIPDEALPNTFDEHLECEC